ncbi:hypothetical protein [Actinomadura alba]|uniref:Uncharacterized protein n=1 Tax=Actinomadura alba TaxID=406431 RepID=A0ABR7M092_9ACTN|nr:hypothetical protein [Actinomadura alba]MBC6470512.1 hypothetical protein [Actinomadura alba]
MAYLLVAFDRLHDLYDSPAELFQAPYADRVEKLFDETAPGQDMLSALPGHVGELLTARGFDVLRHPTGRFAAALRMVRPAALTSDRQGCGPHPRSSYRGSHINLGPNRHSCDLVGGDLARIDTR